jgi:hypothetical protein
VSEVLEVSEVTDFLGFLGLPRVLDLLMGLLTGFFGLPAFLAVALVVCLTGGTLVLSLSSSSASALSS